MAMEAEARPIIAALGAVETDGAPPLPAKFFVARVRDRDVVVAINGKDPRHHVDSIGTEAAALTTFEVVRRFAPDVLISAGTAGGWQSKDARIGDVYVSRDPFVHHDRRIAIPGFDAYGVGSYPSVDTEALAEALGLKQGIVTTSNSLDENDDDRGMIAINSCLDVLSDGDSGRHDPMAYGFQELVERVRGVVRLLLSTPTCCR